MEYDALEIVTDKLRGKLLPASQKLAEIERDRRNRRELRNGAVGDGDLDDESVYRKRELEELEALVDPDVKADIGASQTGQYELVGTCEPP